LFTYLTLLWRASLRFLKIFSVSSGLCQGPCRPGVEVTPRPCPPWFRDKTEHPPFCRVPSHILHPVCPLLDQPKNLLCLWHLPLSLPDSPLKFSADPPFSPLCLVSPLLLLLNSGLFCQLVDTLGWSPFHELCPHQRKV